MFNFLPKTDFACDSVSGMQNFDATQYMGLWYEQQHVLNQPYGGDNRSCITGEYYDLNTETLSFMVENTSETANQLFDKRFGIQGIGKCPTPNLGECYVTFSGEYPEDPTYIVIDTDYNTYSVVYSCDQEREFTYLYYLSKEPVASDEVMTQMQTIAEDSLPDFDFSRMAPRDVQGDMCTYPTPKDSMFAIQ